MRAALSPYSDVALKELAHAKNIAKHGEIVESWSIVEKYLAVNPDDPLALLIGSFVCEKALNLTVSYHLARRLTEVQPDNFAGWNQLGFIADQMWLVDIAERADRRAIKLAATPEDKSAALVNLAALYIQIGEFAKAEPLARQALMANPNSRKARANLGFCQLAGHNWAEGWGNYAVSLGSPLRKKVQYRNEIEWDGTPGMDVAVYGEQGLGDEISFASMIPDAIRDCNKVVIDCDSRLKGLFSRSFQKAKVYGTRWAKPGDKPWSEEDRLPHASVAMGGLGAIYRKREADFPGTAYLVPDENRVMMWKALFAGKGKPVIGLAWTGGVQHTGDRFRRWALQDLLPLFQAIDAHWVCLQYKDSADEIQAFRKEHPEVDLVQYPWATLSNDYDDTAALVASLDKVICMQTAVAHLAGALGKDCWVFVAKTSQWRYGEKGESIPWYKSVRVFRQPSLGQWDWPVRDAAYELSGKRELKEASA